MLFIFNPQSGKGQIKNKLLDILLLFVKKGYKVEVYPTQKKGDAMEITKKTSKQYDRIVISGGDGTLNEVVNGLSFIEKEQQDRWDFDIKLLKKIKDHLWGIFLLERQMILLQILKFRRI